MTGCFDQIEFGKKGGFCLIVHRSDASHHRAQATTPPHEALTTLTGVEGGQTWPGIA